MKLTQEIIDQIQEAMNHTKMNGDPNWLDGDELEVCLGGTFAADKFISIINRRTNPRPTSNKWEKDLELCALVMALIFKT